MTAPNGGPPVPLLDHFRKPASRVPWRSIHSGWIGHLAERVNTLLPQGYIALDTMSIGGGLEIDIGIEEEDEPGPPLTGAERGGTAVATARAVYTPPPATAPPCTSSRTRWRSA